MICVAICTRQRPEMLLRMLNSCANVTSNLRKELIFLVIENGTPDTAETIVNSFKDRISINYVNQPEVGLVNARNTAIESFLKTESKWFASVDDDGAISDDWVSGYLNAIAKFPQARAFAGPTPQVELENATKWYQRREMPVMPLGREYWNVSTANVLLRRDLLSVDSENMRFDPRYNLSGGEDTQFFRRLLKKSIPILWVPTAVILERVDERRGEFKNRVRRSIQFAQNRGKIAVDEYGLIGGVLLNLYQSFLSFVSALVSMAIGLIVLIFNKKYGYRIFSYGVFVFCIATGRLKSIFTKATSYYSVTDGK